MNVAGIVLIVIATFLCFLFAYLTGKVDGRMEEKKNSFKSLHETMDTWLEAQKEAGISEEQLIKVNEILAQKMMKEFSGLAKEF